MEGGGFMPRSQRLTAESVVVAQAIIEGGHIRVDDRLPETIQLRHGQDLHLDFLYRFEEADGDREEFRVRMRSRLGDFEAPEVERQLRDRPLIPDEEWGRIRQAYEAPPVGTHRLTVDFEADYGSRPWSGKGGETVERSETSHEVTVIVEAK